MGRPAKHGVDCFPHYSGSILEDKYGNDGYTFWYKLLERLASIEGHVFDTNEEHPWKVFYTKCRVSKETALEMLELLAAEEAIDQQLWKEYKIIWVQSMVNNLKEIYRKRGLPLPPRPVYGGMTPQPVKETAIQGEMEIDWDTDYHGKPKVEPKQKKSEVKSKQPSKQEMSEQDYHNMVVDIGQIAVAYEEKIGMLTPVFVDTLKSWLDDYSGEQIMVAIDKAHLHGGHTLGYLQRVLMDNNLKPKLKPIEGLTIEKDVLNGTKI